MYFDNPADVAYKVREQNFITRVYGWMCFALVITGLVALFVASTPQIVGIIITNQILFIGLIIVEILAVVAMTALINKISFFSASALFIGYAVLNGITFSVILLGFTGASVASAFFATAGTFAVMSCYGWYTKKDLTTIGNLCFMALIGIIIASVVNIFLHSSMMYWIITYVGVLIFVGLIAYDTQKIKRMSGQFEVNSEIGKKAALMGALALYLDFINLFLMLLRILGGRK
ncbi:MAG TPA: Bax inhibitor-1/YccA family protein [Victivallales bacterium]|nr:Bax inhibitor-1/YccA family protein [Victivallales bacterium]